MITQFDCALDGVALSSLNERICVLDLQEEAPKMRTTSLALQPEGYRLLRRWRDSLTVQVIFAIQDEDPTRRRTTLRSVHTWAEKGGMLTFSDKPGLRLKVQCKELPVMSAEDWQESLTIAFTASASPYWEDVTATSATDNEVVTLRIPGTAPSTPVDAVIVNDSDATVTRLTIRCGDSQMVFDGIELPAGGTFQLTQSDGTLSALLNGTSVLSALTPESDDTLTVPCGQASTMYASGTQLLQASFSVRGRYV